jgi:hypothetical protein
MYFSAQWSSRMILVRLLFCSHSVILELTATDCTDVLHQSVNPSDGVYNVTTWKTNRTIQVYCDMTTADGGWTV